MSEMLSEYFSLEKMIASNEARKNHIDNRPGELHRKNLERLCNRLLDIIKERWGKDKRFDITSGYRGERLNAIVNGSKGSDHCKGLAADIVVGGKAENRKLYDMILNMRGEISWGQLINEDNYDWVHISMPTDSHVGEYFAMVNHHTVPGTMQRVLGMCKGDM